MSTELKFVFYKWWIDRFHFIWTNLRMITHVYIAYWLCTHTYGAHALYKLHKKIKVCDIIAKLLKRKTGCHFRIQAGAWLYFEAISRLILNCLVNFYNTDRQICKKKIWDSIHIDLGTRKKLTTKRQTPWLHSAIAKFTRRKIKLNLRC